MAKDTPSPAPGRRGTEGEERRGRPGKRLRFKTCNEDPRWGKPRWGDPHQALSLTNIKTRLIC